MFQLLHAEDMQNLSGRSNEPAIMEPQTDELDTVRCNLSSKPQSLSGGDFAVNKTKLHYNESKTSCKSISKLTDNESDNTVRKNDVLSPVNNNSSSQLKVNLSRYKQELREYNDTTKHLEKKYHRINTELNEMQIKHEEFLAQRKSKSPKIADNDNDDDAVSYNSTLECSSRPSSAYSLKKKYAHDFVNEEQQLNVTGDNSNKTQRKKHIFSAPYGSDYGVIRTRVPSSLNLKHQRFRRKFIENSNDILQDSPLSAAQNTGLKNIYKALKNMMENQEIQQQKQQKSCKQFINDRNDLNPVDVIQLQNMLSNLQAEQSKSHILIQQQQKCLQEYRNRCMEAQQIVASQKHEIDHLQHNNAKLESDFTAGIEQLRTKIDMKLREVSLLPKMIREERDKNEKCSRDNKGLSERLRVMQQEAQQLRIKLEDISKRKAAALSKLRVAERDLKIFKNQNTALKNEKRRLLDELKKVKEQLGSATNVNKRALTKQREQFEKQRRELQKRIYELEMKLTRMQKSSTGIIQERDKVIAELQSQLNTLVHNFEVSQKHIRVLRRHIYSMPNGSQILPQAMSGNMRLNHG